MIRVLILDDHDLARYGSKLALAAEPDIDVVGDTRLVGQALAIVASARPHVVIVDTLRADGGAIVAARQVRATDPSARVLLLVTDSGKAACACALLAGASGYVRRNATAATMIAVRLIADGHRLLDTADIHAAQAWINLRLRDGEPRQPAGQLRERILELIMAGRTDTDIIARIPISQRRIDGYLAAIVAMLHLPGAADVPVLQASITPTRAVDLRL